MILATLPEGSIAGVESLRLCFEHLATCFDRFVQLLKFCDAIGEHGSLLVEDHVKSLKFALALVESGAAVRNTLLAIFELDLACPQYCASRVEASLLCLEPVALEVHFGLPRCMRLDRLGQFATLALNGLPPRLKLGAFSVQRREFGFVGFDL